MIVTAAIVTKPTAAPIPPSDRIRKEGEGIAPSLLSVKIAFGIVKAPQPIRQAFCRLEPQGGGLHAVKPQNGKAAFREEFKECT